MTAWTTWPVPAKLNLFLHVVGRRSDGYHLLQTVFQLLDWGDTLTLRARPDGVIARAVEVADVTAENDLCVRAALALRVRTESSLGADIALEKRIPIGAGLGGGSSDAATTLVGLNELWGTRLGVDQLAEIGLELGADVPVFVRGHSAWAEGIGEILTPIVLPPRHYVIVDPGVLVPTKPLFQAAELTRNSPPTTISGFLSGAPVANVFAPVVCARYPQVAAAIGWLANFGSARLSGSGGCVFLDVDSAQEAAAIGQQCPRQFVAYCAQGVNASPLHAARDEFRRTRV